MPAPKRPAVAVIIPAYNEGKRIANVLLAAIESKLATEIMVVSDGSTDNTAEVARRFKVRVIDTTSNLGKGGAMALGVASTQARIVAFVDADLVGLEGEHIDAIIQPLLDRKCDMCVGVFRGGKIWSDAAQRIAPFLSGQRAMRREIFEAVPNIAEIRFGIETAITETAKRRKAKVLRVPLRGVSNSYKEKKLGLVEGLAARTKMYKEISQVVFKSKRKPKPRRRRTWL